MVLFLEGEVRYSGVFILKDRMREDQLGFAQISMGVIVVFFVREQEVRVVLILLRPLR